MSKQFTEEDVQKILHQPAYAGVGNFQRLIDDETWISAISTSIVSNGLSAVLKMVSENLSEVGLTVPPSLNDAPKNPRAAASFILDECRKSNPPTT